MPSGLVSKKNHGSLRQAVVQWNQTSFPASQADTDKQIVQLSEGYCRGSGLAQIDQNRQRTDTT
jgi:hypothetical protein